MTIFKIFVLFSTLSYCADILRMQISCDLLENLARLHYILGKCSPLYLFVCELKEQGYFHEKEKDHLLKAFSSIFDFEIVFLLAKEMEGYTLHSSGEARYVCLKWLLPKL